MKKIIIGFFVFGLMFSVSGLVNAQNYGDWSLVGNQGFSAYRAGGTSLALDSNNTPYVAYSDYANNGMKATVMKFDGTSWVNVGNPGFSAGAAFHISIAIGSNNIPYVSYSDNAYGQRATVMKFNGANWTTVGSVGFSAGQTSMISLALDSSNNPLVSYEDRALPYPNNNRITVMRWNGFNWVNVGIPRFSEGIAARPSLAFDSSNYPYVAYIDTVNGTKTTVKKFSNSLGWINVGNPGFSAGQSSDNSLKIYTKYAPYVTSIVPYVAYSDLENGNKVAVMKFDGTNWVNVGLPGFSMGEAYYVSLDISSDGIPYVSFSDLGNGFKATVMKFDGTNWVSVGNQGFSMGGTAYNSLVLDSNNNPYVGYADSAANGKATVMNYVPSLTITYPNGGETFTAGQQFTATWTSTGLAESDQVYFGLFQDTTNVYYPLTYGTGTSNDGTEVFTIPSNIQIPKKYRMYVRKSPTRIFDYSDSSFQIN